MADMLDEFIADEMLIDAQELRMFANKILRENQELLSAAESGKRLSEEDIKAIRARQFKLYDVADSLDQLNIAANSIVMKSVTFNFELMRIYDKQQKLLPTLNHYLHVAAAAVKAGAYDLANKITTLVQNTITAIDTKINQLKQSLNNSWNNDVKPKLEQAHEAIVKATDAINNESKDLALSAALKVLTAADSSEIQVKQALDTTVGKIKQAANKTQDKAEDGIVEAYRVVLIAQQAVEQFANKAKELGSDTVKAIDNAFKSSATAVMDFIKNSKLSIDQKVHEAISKAAGAVESAALSVAAKSGAAREAHAAKAEAAKTEKEFGDSKMHNAVQWLKDTFGAGTDDDNQQKPKGP